MKRHEAVPVVALDTGANTFSTERTDLQYNQPDVNEIQSVIGLTSFQRLFGTASTPSTGSM